MSQNPRSGRIEADVHDPDLGVGNHGGAHEKEGRGGQVSGNRQILGRKSGTPGQNNVTPVGFERNPQIPEHPLSVVTGLQGLGKPRHPIGEETRKEGPLT